MKKFTIALALAATVVATPVMASTKCPGNIARAGGDVAAFVAGILAQFGIGRIFGDNCSPN